MTSCAGNINRNKHQNLINGSVIARNSLGNRSQKSLQEGNNTIFFGKLPTLYHDNIKHLGPCRSRWILYVIYVYTGGYGCVLSVSRMLYMGTEGHEITIKIIQRLDIPLMYNVVQMTKQQYSFDKILYLCFKTMFEIHSYLPLNNVFLVTVENATLQ